MNFFQYNPQSQILQAVDIPLPAALSDIECLDNNLVQHRVEEARRYKSIIKHEFKQGNATVIDLADANRGSSFMAVADALPSIQRNLAPIGAQAVADIIMPQINAQFANVNAQFANINVSLINIHATRDDDAIAPKLQIPVPANPVPLPANFPATKGALFLLSLQQVNLILDYYQLPLAGTLANRRDLLAQHLGLPPRR